MTSYLHIEPHAHVWVLIAEEPITHLDWGYDRLWGETKVTYQTGIRRRFYCSTCRETSEDVETFNGRRRVLS